MGSPSGFITAPKQGVHFELARLAVRELRRAKSFSIKAANEKQLEIHLVGRLKKSRALEEHIRDQIEKVPDEPISKVTAFGFSHGPDIAIDHGTAIEVKLVKGADDLRMGLSQTLVYRFVYRFAIMVLGDWTEHGVLVKSLLEKTSEGAKLLRYLCDEHNIFTVVGPVGPDKPNLVFVPKRTVKPPPNQAPGVDVFSSQAPSLTTIG